ncbi:DUF4244 domain-containing protein [Leucobacter denitrificans]|uniref:DUF4244 domain-containing protein n=2 Tax=Leucobacter denitrificans TaxID=683042 RepID=A0A7G9S7T1_9MICO|nr:DUF4244 domain-containing protein [Leucobacter denitrificans]
MERTLTRDNDELEELLRLGFPAEPAKPEHSRRSVRGRFARWRASRVARELAEDDRGAVTAEYALIIMAAVAFAGLLIVILRSDEVRQMLLTLVQNALNSAG